jgi:subtilisin family serine protease
LRNILLVASIVVLALPAAPTARASALSRKLDPRLAAAAAPGSEPVPVWVEFVDKGEQGPADRIARLAEAERALTPEARARRLRAGVSPLVDELDLPVDARYLAALRAQGLAPNGVSRWFNACVVRASGTTLERLASLDCVRRLAPPDLGIRRPLEPGPAPEEMLRFVAPPAEARGARRTDVAYGQTAWQLARLGVTALHDSGYTGAGVLVAMFDEGFNHYTTHEATRNIDVGNRTRDFVRGVPEVQDTLVSPQWFQHGEWTLSTIGGNAPGVYVGSAFGARFALARTENSASETPVEMVNWAMAAEWADSMGADVISSSLGYRLFDFNIGNISAAMLDGHTSVITRAAEIAAAKGIIVVNSAGNDGFNGLDAPADASGDSIIAVGATDSLGNRASYSSVGPTADGRIKPDLVAQGSLVLLALATTQPNVYGRLSGTSFSCPLVAGVVACLIQARPTLPPWQLILALRQTASKAASPDNLLGYGQVNGVGALFLTSHVPVQPGALRMGLVTANPALAGGPNSVVRFGLPADAAPAHATVGVYDMLGRRVSTLWSGTLAAGESRLASWNGKDEDGRAVQSGLYFIACEAGGRRASVRVTAIR